MPAWGEGLLLQPLPASAWLDPQGSEPQPGLPLPAERRPSFFFFSFSFRSQGLFRSFDDIVRRQLNPIWHTVSPKTKQVVADLRTLRG